MQGRLIYTFASSAARVRDKQACIRGMRLLADTLHPHGVPITWLVSGASAALTAAELTAWHQEFGDAVAVHSPKLTGTVAEKTAALRAERDAVQEALPWADLIVAAHNHQDPDMPEMAAALGFEALWGFCWEQVEVDKFWDRGCPWGFYYIDPKERLRPASGQGVIGMEWTARDLLKSYHSGAPQLYSTDPNDVARGGLCSWEQIDYWKGIADNYLRNARYNRHVFLLQHQEAHEMERSAVFDGYTDEDIREAAIMLAGFVRHLGDRVHKMTLPEAARLYRHHYNATEPSYMLWDDTPTSRPNRDYAWGTPWGPWPRTFLYYDKAAQMMFVEGQAAPVCVRNYANPLVRGEYFAERELPIVRLAGDRRSPWRRELELVIRSPKAMPCGVTVWDDFSLYRVGEAPGLVNAKILAPDLLFLRYDVVEGENRFTVTLQGK